jgi:hypothetical protein
LNLDDPSRVIRSQKYFTFIDHLFTHISSFNYIFQTADLASNPAEEKNVNAFLDQIFQEELAS